MNFSTNRRKFLGALASTLAWLSLPGFAQNGEPSQRNKRGDWEFTQRRPSWELPVHQLMVKHGVTIFFKVTIIFTASRNATALFTRKCRCPPITAT